ncbi:hypothetical protein H4P12_00450 [Paracoccus sp. 11-3]|uniref:Methyltransferase family protein n=1 Tax=Paracoccus amoyensis TaxID=2760093 RepID=A0A926JBW5_9RHOB|nr:class I SAM-dependent methyltransferase [Paracoccus amoyensis]MBC9245213.1 hypothetical protein [Paracoccus amoyensis]
MIDDLSRLAILNGTDKFGLHDYTPVYFDLLKDLQDQTLRMMEIGVGGYGYPDRGGESLATWRDFLPNAFVVGIDIQPKTMDLGPRVKILQGSQVDAEFLADAVKTYGPFDVILDDGSHLNEHVVETFGLLFPTLAPGGIYIVEDVQTATFPKYGGSLELSEPNMVGFFAAMAEGLFNGKDLGDVAAIERFHNIIVIHKRDAQGRGPTAEDNRYVRSADEAGLARHTASPDVFIDADRLNALADSCDDGQVAIVHGEKRDCRLLQELFLHIDHREIRVHFPTAPIHDAAKSVISMAVYPGQAVLVAGDNDYPSNFAFDTANPRVVSAIAEMAQAIQDEAATANGILMYLSVSQKMQQVQNCDEYIERLAALKSTDRRYYRLAIASAMAKNDWTKTVSLGREALQHHSDDPQFSANLARGLRFTDGVDAAHDMLSAAYQKMPRAMPIINGLASLKVAKGDVDGGIQLHEICVELTRPHARAKRLQDLLKLCRAKQKPEASRRVAEKLLEYTPDDPDALDVLQKTTSR